MNRTWPVVRGAALAAVAAFVRPARAQLSISEVPAVYSGGFTCPAKYPGSFLDMLTAACWQCPATHPERSAFPNVAASNACRRPPRSLFRKASGPENPTGLPPTCRSGWFPHWDLKCYNCGSGYNRTADPNIASPRACQRVIPEAWSPATRKGVEGCLPGAFRNGLTASCFACPPDYSRNAVVADDLTKVKACTRISTAARDEARAKFERHKNDHPETRASLGRSANAYTTAVNPSSGSVVPDADSARRSEMRGLIDDEYEKGGEFKVVTWLVTGGGSLAIGYTHAEGFAMTRIDENSRVCRKAWANSFTAGLSVGAGGVEQMEFSKEPLREGLSESNGWQVGASFPPLAAGLGVHSDASTGSLILSLAFGPGFDLGLNASEYVHTWTETGKVVDCSKLTWGTGWKDL